MRAERLLRALADDRTVFGTALHLSDPAVVEICALAGYDWVSIILEHASLSVGEIAAMQRAADVHGITTMVHVSDARDPRILPLLNAGVGGIVAPGVESAAEVEALVRATYFPPIGDRGAHGSVRAASYGDVPYPAYTAEANRTVAAGVVIESRAGAANAAEIFDVPGIAFAYIGLADLSQSCGRPGEYRHPEVHRAVLEIVRCARERRIPVGLSAYGYSVPELRAIGARMVIAPTSDYVLLSTALRDHLARARTALGELHPAEEDSP